MDSQTTVDERKKLITAARLFYQRGWMVGTAGNLSARQADGSFWITASGKAKGELTTRDFVRVHGDGKVEAPYPNLKPSAETSIHQAIYSLFPEAMACYHVHSIEANLVSMFAKSEDTLHLPPLEMLKGLGIWQENPCCQMALFNNHLDVTKIASKIEVRFRNHPPKIPALLIRNHGVTVWGASPETALNYIELAEYIFRYMVAAHQMGENFS